MTTKNQPPVLRVNKRIVRFLRNDGYAGIVWFLLRVFAVRRLVACSCLCVRIRAPRAPPRRDYVRGSPLLRYLSFCPLSRLFHRAECSSIVERDDDAHDDTQLIAQRTRNGSAAVHPTTLRGRKSSESRARRSHTREIDPVASMSRPLSINLPNDRSREFQRRIGRGKCILRII